MTQDEKLTLAHNTLKHIVNQTIESQRKTLTKQGAQDTLSHIHEVALKACDALIEVTLKN